MARTGVKNSSQIINNASSLCSLKHNYMYWYGGKDNLCTQALLDQLSKLYPKIYTKAYKNKCKQGITAKKRCIDCSGLVCKVYNVPDIGTSQFNKYWSVYNGTPKNGMIVWREGHCGIYYDKCVLEAKGINYGIQLNKYNASDWTRVYYDPNISYGYTMFNLDSIAKEVIKGTYGNGVIRVQNLKKIGFNDEDIKEIQNRVNKILSK